VTTRGAVRAFDDDARWFGFVDGRQFEDLAGIALPLPFHARRNPQDDDIEKAADQQAKNNSAGNGQRWECEPGVEQEQSLRWQQPV